MRLQMRLKLDYFLACNISDNICYYIKLGMTVDLWMPYIIMLVLMTLTMMQVHSGPAKAKNQCCMLSATKQAISIQLATVVGHLFYVTLTLTLQTFTWFDSLFVMLSMDHTLIKYLRKVAEDKCPCAKWLMTI